MVLKGRVPASGRNHGPAEGNQKKLNTERIKRDGLKKKQEELGTERDQEEKLTEAHKG